MGGYQLPKLNYQITAQLRAGSFIEFENVHAILKTTRGLGIILHMDWNPLHASSRARVLTASGNVLSVDVNSICKVYII